MEPLRSRRGSNGFTLVEMMVVIAIIIIITAVVITSQSSFNKSIVLTNTAYDVALTLRFTQTYGIGSHALGSGCVANTGYGVHFAKGTTSSFILFADSSPASACATPDQKPGDHVYTSGSDTLVQTYTLGNKITISDFCTYVGATPSCAYAHGAGLTSLDIGFARPNPDAYMSTNGSYSATITQACITLTSPQGGFQYLTVGSAGQISANAAACP